MTMTKTLADALRGLLAASTEAPAPDGYRQTRAPSQGPVQTAAKALWAHDAVELLERKGYKATLGDEPGTVFVKDPVATSNGYRAWTEYDYVTLDMADSLAVYRFLAARS